MELPDGMVTAVLSLLAVVHPSSAGVRELAVQVTILHKASRTGPTLVGAKGVLTLPHCTTVPVRCLLALVDVLTDLTNGKVS